MNHAHRTIKANNMAYILDEDMAIKCSCATHSDGSITTMLCPQHAQNDPCQTTADVTGKRRSGTIRNGTCTSCGWSSVPVWKTDSMKSPADITAGDS